MKRVWILGGLGAILLIVLGLQYYNHSRARIFTEMYDPWDPELAESGLEGGNL